MNRELTPDLKQIFKDAAARRKERGIHLKKWSIMIESNLEGTIEELWGEWTGLLGSDRSAILLQHLMLRTTELLRELKRRQDARKARENVHG